MKKIAYISLAAIAATMGLMGCNKAEIAPVEKSAAGNSFALYTEITKTTNDDLSTKWAANDAINVFHAAAGTSTYSGNSQFAITAENLEAGKFTGDLTGDLAASNDWSALYPYNSAITTPAGNEGGTVVIGSETAQYQADENSMAHLAGTGCPLFAQTKGVAKDAKVSLAFKPAVSVVKLHVVNMTGNTQTINSVSVTASEPIAGQFTVNFTGSEPVYTAVSGKSSNTAYLKLNTAVELSSGNSTDFYIVVKPFTNAAGATLKFSVNGYTKTSTEAVTFSRGSIKTVNFGFDKEKAEIVKSKALPSGVICKNTTPVFSPDCETAYFVTLGTGTCTKRYLYSINLSDGAINWNYDLTNTTKAWYGNGGNICVNPKNGDIICSNQCDLFVIKSNGDLRWSKANLGGVAASNGATLMIGSGPAMSNDNSVIFVPYKDGIYALNAETGDEIDKLAFGVTVARIQMAVYGNNNIVCQTYVSATSLTDAVKFITFDGSKFTVVKKFDAVIPDLSDISCPAVSSDQSKVYFVGKRTSSGGASLACVDLDSQSLSSSDNLAAHSAGNRWSCAISENGMLAHTTVYTSTSAGVCVLDANKALSSDNFSVIYQYTATGANAVLNFEGAAFDREGSIYFFLYDSKKLIGSTTDNYFYKMYFDGVGYQTEVVATTTGATGGTYQGAFAFGGHYLVAIQGSPAVVHICNLGSAVERAHSWGNGGNACHTNNASQIAQ